jgi:hypothetical protein
VVGADHAGADYTNSQGQGYSLCLDEEA